MDANDSTPTNFVQYWMSNASTNMYPDNKPQQFKIHLAKPLQLKGEWELGLNSIFYPYNWFNVKQSLFTIYFETKGGPPRKQSLISVKFPAAQFDKLESIAEALNKAIHNAILKQQAELDALGVATDEKIRTASKYIEFIEKVFTPFKAGQNPHLTTTDYISEGLSKKYEMICTGGAHEILVNKDYYSVFGMLGFAPTQIRILSGEVAKFYPSLHLHQPALFVYTPIINEVAVGDVKAKLLSLVPIQGKPHDMVYVRFEKPVYNRITHNYISDIEVSINDDQGELIQFIAGKVMMVVHFRRIG